MEQRSRNRGRRRDGRKGEGNRKGEKGREREMLMKSHIYPFPFWWSVLCTFLKFSYIHCTFREFYIIQSTDRQHSHINAVSCHCCVANNGNTASRRVRTYACA